MPRRAPSPEWIKSQIDMAIDTVGTTLTFTNPLTMPDSSPVKAVMITRERDLMKALNIDGEKNEKLWTGFQARSEMSDRLSTGMEFIAVGNTYRIDLLQPEVMRDSLIYILIAAYQL